jgi:hypothetical protein
MCVRVYIWKNGSLLNEYIDGEQNKIDILRISVGLFLISPVEGNKIKLHFYQSNSLSSIGWWSFEPDVVDTFSVAAGPPCAAE